jgi:multiple sugar transport system substrate-binding protein
MGWGAGETEVENYQIMIDDFEEENPNVIVKYEVVTQSLHENVLASFGAGVAPDIFYMDSQWAPRFMEAGALYAIDDLTTQTVIDEYYDFLLEPFTGSDDKVYGLPKDWSMLQLYYNKDILSSAGWTDPPDTWEELKECAMDITDDSGKPGLCLYDGNFNRFVPTATSNGASGPWFESAADADWFDDTAVEDSLEYYIGLFTEGKEAAADPWLALPADVDAGWLGDAFGSEEVGMTISGNWAIPFLNGTYPNFIYGTDWGIAPIPKGSSGRATMAYTVALGINADTEYPEEAWDFVEFLLGKEGQTELVVKMGQTLPSIKGLEDHADLWPQHAATLSHVYDTITVFVWGPQGAALETDFSTTMASAMKAEITVTEAIAVMKDAVEDAFAD